MQAHVCDIDKDILPTKMDMLKNVRNKEYAAICLSRNNNERNKILKKSYLWATITLIMNNISKS